MAWTASAVQTRSDNAPLSATQGTSVPSRLLYIGRRSSQSSTSAFRQPSAVTCTALPSECARPSGFFCRWPEGLECTSRRSPGSYTQQWQFPLDTQDIPIRWTLTACSTLEADAAMRYRNLRLTLTLDGRTFAGTREQFKCSQGQNYLQSI